MLGMATASDSRLLKGYAHAVATLLCRRGFGLIPVTVPAPAVPTPRGRRGHR